MFVDIFTICSEISDLRATGSGKTQTVIFNLLLRWTEVNTCSLFVWCLSLDCYNAVSFFFFFAMLHPKLCLGCLILEVSRWHRIRHTHTHTHISKTPLNEWSACLNGQAITFTTCDKHKRWMPMSSVGFEPVVSALKPLQNHALDRMATRIGVQHLINCKLNSDILGLHNQN